MSSQQAAAIFILSIFTFIVLVASLPRKIRNGLIVGLGLLTLLGTLIALILTAFGVFG